MSTRLPSLFIPSLTYTAHSLFLHIDNTKNTGFYSIPAGPSDQLLGKSPCLGEMLLFTVYSCLQVQIMELTGPPYVCQIPCFARDFRKGPKRQLRRNTPGSGGMLLFTAYSCLQAGACNLPVRHRRIKSHVLPEIFAKAQKDNCAGKRPARKPNGPSFALKMPFSAPKTL